MGVTPVAEFRRFAQVLVTNIEPANVADLMVDNNQLTVQVIIGPGSHKPMGWCRYKRLGLAAQ